MISDREALDLADVAGSALARLTADAAATRDRIFGRRITFSPKVFLPLTNLCRNRCDYCSFRRSPGDAGAHTMTPDEVDACLDRARAAGCIEALFCLGDTPETAFRSYRALLAELGHGGTVDYLVWAGRRALERGLLPHTNAGVLSRADMERLREVNVSLGLMLENVSERLCGPGMPHHRAPDKRPERRVRMTREAGELRIAFTSGLLLGIGETRRERVETLLAIRALHAEHGHVQEVIVQPFRAHPATPMRASPEPDEEELARAIALARLILPDDVSVQAPPNLSPASLVAMIAAGIDDLGGISPVTPDYINPRHPWPHLDGLAAACAAEGFALRPRLPIHDRFAARPGLLDDALVGPVRTAAERLAGVRPPGLVPAPEPASEARP
jgi:FO synthase